MGALNNLLTGFFDIIHNLVESIGVTNLGFGYVLDIVIYTLILKTIMLPLFVYQQKGTKGMSEVQPKMKELQEKYKNDPKKLQEEQIKLYKELGVNPFKGCLPLFVQMPIFIAMFTVLSSYHGFNGVPFLWIKNLAKPDNFYILPVLTAVLQYVSIKVTSKNMDEEQKKMQNKMGITMSIVFLFICINYKAVLAIYFISSSVIQMVQTLMVNKYLEKEKAKEDAIKKAKEEERLAKEAEEKAAKREEYKKKKKKKAESSEELNKADKPVKKKRTEESQKLKDDNKDGKVVE
ncbi:membrane protein insertase YidC [Clostridium cylindrosporum]|uniref:Inner membrane protein translocase component YidC n=1 Tax=Clostridium cylindrosporum DSM 605 TaxID=1121307 RepID=A0A0J8D6N3_CLOCY|nr:membrane protein insertase YidC [Clostridium cylindrosporum]KMT21745.1 inner membrane protein translocase component YidC [Clostridium cylindrosporum DSM 605]